MSLAVKKKKAKAIGRRLRGERSRKRTKRARPARRPARAALPGQRTRRPSLRQRPIETRGHGVAGGGGVQARATTALSTNEKKTARAADAPPPRKPPHTQPASDPVLWHRAAGARIGGRDGERAPRRRSGSRQCWAAAGVGSRSRVRQRALAHAPASSTKRQAHVDQLQALAPGARAVGGRGTPERAPAPNRRVGGASSPRRPDTFS